MVGAKPRRRLPAPGVVLAAAAVLATAAGLWLARLRPAPAPLRAELRVYDLVWRASIRAAGPDAQGWAVEAAGRLALKRYAGGAVAGRLENGRIAIDGAAAEYRGIERPFSFHEDARGYLTGFVFAPGVPEETRAFVRQSVAAVHVASPERPRDRWQVRERDALGVFRASYERDGARSVRKRKLEYLPPVPGDEPGDGLAREVVESEAVIELSDGSYDVARVRVREVLRARPANAFEFEERTELEAALVEAPDPFPAGFAEFEAERDRVWEAAPAPLAARAPDAGSGDAPKSLGEALRAYGELRTRNLSAAEAAVIAWLRGNPGSPRDLLAFLDACSRGEHPEIDAATQAALFRLLAVAGTPESLDALIDAASDTRHHPHTRALALAHMDQVPVAELRQVDALLALTDRERETPGGDQLARTALLVTGALGHSSLGPPEVADRVVTALEERLAGAQDPSDRRTAVLAMGNCGDPRLVGSLERMLGDSEPRVRAAAAHAFRRLDADEAVPRLLARYKLEPLPEVRAAIIGALASYAWREDVVAWARAELLVARDEPSLLALVELIGPTAARSPESVAALRALLARSPGRVVERAVLRFVAPRD